MPLRVTFHKQMEEMGSVGQRYHANQPRGIKGREINIARAGNVSCLGFGRCGCDILLDGASIRIDRDVAIEAAYEDADSHRVFDRRAANFHALSNRELTESV